MDLEERLSYLENVRDWQGLVEELEKGVASSASPTEKAGFHLKLGRVLEGKFLAGVKALKHFQDAYKLNPALTESLEAARNVYWGLGKLNMVQKLLELELKAAPNGKAASALLLELGDVLCDEGKWDDATATYAKALGATSGNNAEATARLTDLQVDAGTWHDHLNVLVHEANGDATVAEKGRVLMRAVRVARRFSAEEAEGMLARAYAADPSDKQVSALYETILSEQGRFSVLEQAQQQALQQVADRRLRGALALVFGTRWVVRHQNLEIGTRLLEEAFKLDPENEGAFFFLTEVYGKKGGDWDRVLTLAEEAATRGDGANVAFVLAQAGTIAWRRLGNLMRARASFERLGAVAPDHPQLRAFEAQIGETLKPAVRSAQAADGAPAVPDVTPRAAETTSSHDDERARAPADAPAAPAPTGRAPVAAAPAEELVVDRAKLAELRQLAEKQEGAKRYNEFVKTIL
jgi:tetratricopeptide (TPR) repeat protein